jgi:hypothetical protein
MILTLLAIGLALCLALILIGEKHSAIKSRFWNHGRSLMLALRDFASSCLELLKTACGHLISRLRRPPSTPE